MPAPLARTPLRRIAIAGLGLIGGSIAARLRRSSPAVRIAGIDADSVLDRASARNLIDERHTSPAGVDADLLVLAAPIDVVGDLLASASSNAAIVTDTCSTKRGVMAAAADAGVRRFVGGHPMAGSEHAGLDHADPDLFEQRPWLLVSSDPSGADAKTVSEFVASLGARPTFVDADWHDRTMAYVSHLPQLLAVALMNAAGEACGDAGLAAGGRALAEMTRLAASPADLWQGILRANADNVAEALAAVAAELPAEPACLTDDRLRGAFTRAQSWRARLAALSGPSS